MARAVFRFDQGGQEAQVVWDIDVLTTAVFAASQLRADVWDNLKARTSNECDLVDITVTDGNTTHINNVNEPGTRVAAVLPSSNGALITKVADQGRNGRMFWPGLPEADIDATGRFSVSAQGAWNTAITAMDSAVSNQTDYVGRIFRDPPAVSATFESFSLRPVIGTQRRRLR